MPIVPIPALTRFSAAGHPNPPTPSNKILEEKNFGSKNINFSLHDLMVEVVLLVEEEGLFKQL